jgi:hypothetical protein
MITGIPTPRPVFLTLGEIDGARGRAPQKQRRMPGAPAALNVLKMPMRFLLWNSTLNLWAPFFPPMWDSFPMWSQEPIPDISFMHTIRSLMAIIEQQSRGHWFQLRSTGTWTSLSFRAPKKNSNMFPLSSCMQSLHTCIQTWKLHARCNSYACIGGPHDPEEIPDFCATKLR